MPLIVNHKKINLTSDGFLCDPQDWSEDVAYALARQYEITLNVDHFKVLAYLRKLHIEHQHSPSMRALVKGLSKEYGEELGNSLTLQKLFPGGALKQSHLLAGLPKPPHCV